jgi:hypothetical protein
VYTVSETERLIAPAKRLSGWLDLVDSQNLMRQAECSHKVGRRDSMLDSLGHYNAGVKQKSPHSESHVDAYFSADVETDGPILDRSRCCRLHLFTPVHSTVENSSAPGPAIGFSTRNSNQYLKTSVGSLAGE